MLSKTGRFRRADRILRTRDFRRVVKSGKRRVSGSFVVIVASATPSDSGISDEKTHRLGVTVSKRVGNAVVRNRVKRCIREWFRHARVKMPGRSEVVVIARHTARDLSGKEVAAFLDRAIEGVNTRVGHHAAMRSQ